MRGTSPVAVVVLLLAGCLGSGEPSELAPSTNDLAAAVPGAAAAGLLNASNHVAVHVSSTLSWSLKNLTGQSVAVTSTLVYLAEALPTNHHEVNGNPILIAFIPHADVLAAGECKDLSADVHAYYGPKDGRRLGTLPGTYAKGWYHAVLVSRDNATFSMTFNASSSQKSRTPPLPDPFLHASTGAAYGSRTPKLTAEVPEGTWFAWARHQIPPDGVDAGRTQSIRFLPNCQEARRAQWTAQQAFLFQQPLTVTTNATGTSPSFDIEGRYEPNVEPGTPDSTSLEAVWAWVPRIELPDVAPGLAI